MTIEIDDAGTGDLVGDAFIGLLRKETGELIFKTLPIDLFKGVNWKNKKPFFETVKLVQEGLRELNFQRDSFSDEETEALEYGGKAWVSAMRIA